MYIFGYGSLMNKKSAQNALKRVLDSDEFIAAELAGFHRVWRAKEKIYFEDQKAEKIGVFLDLEKMEGKCVNGILIHISIQELEQMKLREKNYNCIDVTKYILTKNPIRRVFTFVSKPEHRAKTVAPNCYVPQGYLNIIKQGCGEINAEFYARYLQTTEAFQHPIQKGKYFFVDPVQAIYT